MCKCIRLENGLRIVYEKIPHVRSVSTGIWVGAGSKGESIANNGISHFIEHMLFKGTKKRSAKGIAEAIDNIGGQLNAFTGKECTCYFTKTLDSHFNISLDVLADMFFNSRFDQKDIDIEKNVVLEEIGMYEDAPEELVHDILSEAVWKNNSLGMPILGTDKSLINIDKNQIKKYMKSNYLPQNVVIAVAGNFEENKVIESIKEKFGSWKNEDCDNKKIESVEFKNNKILREKETEQVHICLGFKGLEHGSEQLYSLLAVNNIFGGGMSSRLFQKIREQKGLVYSIYSYPSAYKNAGLFTVYAGMNPEHLNEVLKLIMDEIKILIKTGISDEDIYKSKEQLKGNYILGLESTSSRMNIMGKSELLLERILSAREVLDKIDRINSESINTAINKVFDLKNIGLSMVGNIKDDIDLEKI
ncbi:pitrilysin family protein [Herbivorax sp. ANBcel31]|uniref:M16 family metallopeptidase n=1 Tax=Herbivorax sp. ANBcel31 TaxID=3069754 RepID=UPI0027B064CC|nr:pitrilysin family protein [Herbivorax sp. ANBcel31]MDQ2085848.1 pitrilysin family protein [Herbivorax sp. ANBcel31]